MRILALAGLLALTASMAQADAQFSAEDIIEHFKKSRAAKQEAMPAVAARPGNADAPLVLPLTGAKRTVRLGTAKSRSGGEVGAGNLNLFVTFESGSDTLTGQAMRNLDAFASALLDPELASFAFEVQGHTDAAGAADDNQLLSERRAASVVGYLVGKGVARDRLEARGFGETRPVMSDPNHPSNRRVETRRIR